MLCTRSICPSALKARTSACFAEIHIQAFKRCRGASASQDRSLKGKRKGRELQALEITLFQYRKGEGEREGGREREGGGGGEREREREREREGNGDARKSGRSPDQGTKLRGGRALTSDPYTHPALDPLVRPPTYSWKSEHWKNVSNCFTKDCFCKLLMPCVVTSTAAYNKVLSSMKNAHIMLEMAGKCSSYARNWGLCFSFWIMLFEADYAKNYASILYQCLRVFGRRIDEAQM